MKILIVNTTDISGGAARAAYRLFKALQNEGIIVYMLVQRKFSDDYKVLSPNSKIDKFFNLLRPTIDQLPVKFYKNRTKTLFSPSWIGNKKILKMIKDINPDIVHLHWINGGMIKIEDLTKINKPLVWSLHDNFAFTGGCHIKWECENYRQNCGNCPRLGSNIKYDLSRWVWNRKNKVFKQLNNLTIVGLSRWVNECSKESSLLKDKKHINLPNPIDIDIFKPFDKEKSRELWNLPKNKKLILFGAMSATSDINKGFKELSEALQLLKTEYIEFVVFGSTEPQNPPKFNFKTHYIGRLNDDVSLVTLYSAVDVMIVPSLQENLSNAIMESLSCTTPVVGFDIGGNSDMIEHKINGYLAKPFEAQDLANGIEWVLDSDSERRVIVESDGDSISRYEWLCKNAREKVLKEFDSRVVAKKYIELYEEIL